MIHSPSRVACKPFGAGPGESKTVSTLPIFRVRMRAGSKREAAIAVAAVAAVSANNSLRFMGAPLRDILYQGRAAVWAAAKVRIEQAGLGPQRRQSIRRMVYR